MTRWAIPELPHLRLSFRGWLRSFVHGVHENPHGGTDRAVLQGVNAHLHAIKWEFDKQDFNLRAPSRKPQCEIGKDCEIVPNHQQVDSYLGGKDEHSRARVIKPAGTKSFHGHRPER